MQTTKVNNKKVHAIPVEHVDERPVKGADVCPHPYANMGLFGAENKGKTSIIFKLTTECMGRDTTVLAFVSTLHNDAQWKVIEKKVEGSHHPFLGYTSLRDEKSGHNVLEAFVKGLQGGAESEDDKEEAKPAAPIDTRAHNLAVIAGGRAPTVPEPEPERKERKKRATKYRAPEYI